MKNFCRGYLLLCLCIGSLLVWGAFAHAQQTTISLFPLDNYDQNPATWINPLDPNYGKNLMLPELQQKRLELFQEHYFGRLSPWSNEFVTKLIKKTAPDDLYTMEKEIIKLFSNENKPEDRIGYGENFHPRTKKWLDDIVENMDTNQFKDLSYTKIKRGISVDNLHVRALPTDDVFFYHYKLAGEGYPFDNLQMSALWIGTPVYILGETKDHAWMLVLTPDFIGWVKSSGIAQVDVRFVKVWIKYANQQLAAIIQPKTSLIDPKGHFISTAYVGAVFPAKTKGSWIDVVVPVKQATSQMATMVHVTLPPEKAVFMPLAATPQHFSMIITNQIGRPYSWGGKYFYNDCSAELKSLLTPFGIWLPRHSSDQLTQGRMLDLSKLDPENRIKYLKDNGKSFLTIIYIGGHVMLYVGSAPKENNQLAITYQTMWGLHPASADRRAVIGRAVLFPLLLQYPEDTTLISHAAYSTFIISDLSILPKEERKQEKLLETVLPRPSEIKCCSLPQG